MNAVGPSCSLLYQENSLENFFGERRRTRSLFFLLGMLPRNALSVFTAAKSGRRCPSSERGGVGELRGGESERRAAERSFAEAVVLSAGV